MSKIIVVDTSVFVSALLSSEDASPEILRQSLLGKYQPIMGTTLYNDAETRFHARAIKGSAKKGLAILNKLDNHFKKSL